MSKRLCVATLTLLLLVSLSAVPRRYCVVEIALSTSCSPCRGAAWGANDLLANGHNVAVVNYYYSPYSNSYSEARRSYYGISGTPTAFFDGGNQQIGGSSTSSMYSIYLPKVNARLTVASHFTISATGTATGDQYAVNVTVAKPEADSNTNVVLHAAITQSNIAAYAWGANTYLNNVNRLMSPGAGGTPVSLNTGEQTTIPLSFTFSSTLYNPHECELVLWLQNTVTKEILQAEKFPFDFLFKDFSASPLNGIAPLAVQFQNYASAAGLSAHWDFENDGVFDHTGNNPLHSYTEPGTYSVKYQVTFRDLAETLVKTDYITVAAPVLPLPPDNVQISRIGSDMVLSWDPVTLDTAGEPLVTDFYRILYAFDPNAEESDWQELTTTTGLGCTDWGGALAAFKRFYRILAVAD